MADCEVCGKMDAHIDCIIEGTKLRVCANCSSLGKVIFVETTATHNRRKAAQKLDYELEIVDNYADRIRKARTALKLSTKELASLIDEKESFLERIEKETTVPTEKTARKLEKQLKIKLLEEVRIESVPKAAKQKTEVTLGDVVDISKD